jgi:hypothetical protein
MTGLTLIISDFVVVLKSGTASVKANLFKLLASQVNSGVKFCRRFIQGHQLIKRADFELTLVYSKSEHLCCF